MRTILPAVVVAVAVTSIACHQEGLWIDDRCSDWQVDSVYRAADQLNAVLGKEVVWVAGMTDVADDNRDMVICVPPDRGCDHRFVGSVANGNINMRECQLERYGDDLPIAWHELMLHELVHYVGIDEHSCDHGAVTSRFMNWDLFDDYTEADKQWIKDNYQNES